MVIVLEVHWDYATRSFVTVEEHDENVKLDIMENTMTAEKRHLYF